MGLATSEAMAFYSLLYQNLHPCEWIINFESLEYVQLCGLAFCFSTLNPFCFFFCFFFNHFSHVSLLFYKCPVYGLPYWEKEMEQSQSDQRRTCLRVSTVWPHSELLWQCYDFWPVAWLQICYKRNPSLVPSISLWFVLLSPSFVGVLYRVTHAFNTKFSELLWPTWA